ncbi:hypothetical protein [Pseudomonas baetica]|uniref:hypothetical protein n=1 Tax=Pseudomonas baetica TaxID=674054 RepID=UPI002406BA59|nr:hypothetical protein [Pseudomonas baetica]MDF9778938.1 hypothetical protein [Pseudomonas baetica]
MSNSHPMGISDLEYRKRVRNISAAIANSFNGWNIFEPHLCSYTGITPEDLHGAYMSVAVAIAKIVANRVVTTATPSFVAQHCDHPFHFPRMPAEFIGAPFLQRVSHAEWAAIGTALMIPTWLEQSILEWAKTQGLKLMATEG